MNGYYDLGIVGGGPSAVCLLDALARAEGLPSRTVAVFEPSAHLWRGRPYRPDFDTVRVNAPARDMSLRAGDDGHFEEWLAARELVIGLGSNDIDPVSGTRFVSRASYGDYLEQTARAALITLHRRGWLIDIVRDAVTGARPAAAGGVHLQTAGSGQARVTATVLCVGAGRPPALYGLGSAPGYVPEAYPIRESLAPIEPDGDVCVLGSGLTGVDVVLGLAARGHRGPIRLVSRTGALPAVRQRAIGHRLRRFTPEWFRAAAASGRTVTLAQTCALMAEELAAAGDSPGRVAAEIGSARTELPVPRLRRHLSEVDSPLMGLRILQQAVPDAGPDAWPLLPEADKERLLAEHERTLMSLCCPMPPAAAAHLLTLIDSGQLSIVSGVRHVEAQGGGFRIRTEDRDFTGDYVVNASNARIRPVAHSAESLISSLVRAGLAEPHPRGGLSVERAASRLTVLGATVSGIYALGDPAAGSLFFTFGVQSLVDRASDIVADLARSAQPRPEAKPAPAAPRHAVTRQLTQSARSLS